MKQIIQIFRLLDAKFALIYFLAKIYELTFKVPYKLSFSQLGEDTILNFYLRKFKGAGIYVDIGCNHPVYGNNTIALYLKGWKGISVDGNSELIKQFQNVRKKDRALCEIVSNISQDLKFYRSTVDKVSTVDLNFIDRHKDIWSYDVTNAVSRVATTLDKLIFDYLPGQRINFLNIDVEGHDLEVLQGLDLNQIRPDLILVEITDNTLNLSPEHNPIFQHLLKNNYVMISFFCVNGLFLNKDVKEEYMY